MAVRPHEASSFEEAFKEGVEFGKEQGLRDGLKTGRVEGRNAERNKQDAREANRGGRCARLVYTADGNASYFRDLLNEHRATRTEGRMHSGETTEARKRLAKFRDQHERSIGMGEATTLDVTAVPPFLRELWATTIHAASVLPGILDARPLPPKGLVVQTGKLTAGGNNPDVHPDKGGVAESSPTAALVEAPVVEIAGLIDAGRVLHDRVTGADAALIRELAEATAAKVDAEILYGDGTDNLRGLSKVVDSDGGTAVTWTTGTPTQAAFWAKLLDAIQQVSVKAGRPPTSIVAHPRRVAWLSNWIDGASGTPAVLELPFGIELVACPSISTTLGASTNQDEVYVLIGSEIPYFAEPFSVTVHESVGSTTGLVRIAARQMCALLANRRGEAVARISGTGLTTPSFA